jgi:SAM-dependent methyltransferase
LHASSSIEHHGFKIPRHLAWRTGRLEHFGEVSDEHIEHLKKYAQLADTRNVVEIGCGVGRDAIPLTKILSHEGSYLGIDIMKQSIAWASENITPRAGNFRFVHFDVADAQHNPGGSKAMREHRIPCADESQDLVFLYSVFTHMFPDDASYYLKEFTRILRPSGRVLASMFTMDRSLQPHLLAIGGGGLRNLTFSHELEDGFFHNDPAVVPGATAYSLERFGRMLREAGLFPERFVRGSWRKDGVFEVNDQDILVLRKPAF